MKTVTAEIFNKAPAKVYREADREGTITIKHKHYPDSVFVLTVKRIKTSTKV